MDEDTQVPTDSEDFRKRLTVPSGFRNLLEGLTVEILRCNPDNIYKFAADYFHTKLKERQGSFDQNTISRVCEDAC